MTAPDRPGGLDVETGALRRDADAWHGVSRDLGGPLQRIRGLGAVPSPVFSLLAENVGLPAKYAELTTTMTRLLEQATQVMDDIGSTLRSAADTYEREDREGARRLGGPGPGG